MQIKMTRIQAGPGGNFQPSDKRTVSDEEGRALIAAGAAIDITPPRFVEFQPVEESPPRIEVATLPEPEQAVTRGRKGRGR